MNQSLLLLIAALMAPSIAKAASPPNSVPSITFTKYVDGLVAEAKTNNPALLAAVDRARTATTRAEGPALLLPKNVSNAEAALRSAELDYQLQVLRRDLMKGLLDSALAYSVLDFDRQHLAWIEATEDTVEAKYRVGQATLADTLLAQNDYSVANDQVLTSRHRLIAAHLSLNRLLNRGPNRVWPTLELPDLSPALPFSQALVSLALTNGPYLKLLNAQLNFAKAQADWIRESARQQSDLTAAERALRFGRSSLNTRLLEPRPLTGGELLRDLASAAATPRATELEREDQILMAREAMHHLSVNTEAFRREALVYREQVGVRSAQILTNRLSAWETGRGTIREVLDARRAILDSQLKAAQAAAEQLRAAADLALWTGLNGLEELSTLADEESLIEAHAFH